jgi:D-aspartate ligase
MVIVQEWVPGPDSNIYYCLAYITPDGKVLSRFVGRKIHQLPILLGSTASAEAANEPLLKKKPFAFLPSAAIMVSVRSNLKSTQRPVSFM